MLKISRDDIPSDKLLTYDDPFLRLPIDKYMGKMGQHPNGPQTAIINALNNPKYRFVTAAISRRLGKTYIANIIAHLTTLVPDTNVLVMSPDYSVSSISWELQHKFCQQYGIELTKSNQKDKVMELCNGSTLRIGSLNRIDSCVGRSYKFILFDEAALQDGMKAFQQSLRPTLDTANSKCLFISTPRGLGNWFAELYNRGFAEDYMRWASVKASWHENPRASEEDIEEARRTMSAALFKQEYEADFNVYEGQIWSLDHTDIIDTIPDTSNFDVFGGLDVGFRDPTAFVVVAHDRENDIYYIIDEYHGRAKSTSTHAEEINNLIDKYDIDNIFIDSAAAQTKFDLAMDYGISTNNAKKSITDGIAHVAAHVDNSRIKVYKECKNVLYAFDQYQWEKEEKVVREKPLHNKACHMADAIRYALYSYSPGGGIY